MQSPASPAPTARARPQAQPQPQPSPSAAYLVKVQVSLTQAKGPAVVLQVGKVDRPSVVTLVCPLKLA